jgi:hypothetical protein
LGGSIINRRIGFVDQKNCDAALRRLSQRERVWRFNDWTIQSN